MEKERNERPKRRKRSGALACLIIAAVACFVLLVVCCNKMNKSSPKNTTRFLPSLRASRREDDDKVPEIIKGLSNEFPSLEDSIEMARLSGLVYAFKHYENCNATKSDGTPLLPSDLSCHLYHHDQDQGTQVMILSSTSQRYIALVFAGTDDFRTTLTDTNIIMKPFGPLDKDGESIWIPGEARVHAGFDNQVFRHGLFDRLFNQTSKLLQDQPDYRLFTTGHSLGGADAILTAVALAHKKLTGVDKITCINFGCPNVGNEHWRTAIHNLNETTTTKLSIWRFVHGWDVIPRLPEYPFTHVGHTVQMNSDAMRAFYLHRGNVSLNYASVPIGWAAKPFIFLPVSLWSHHIRKYQDYLRNESTSDPSRYYVSEFEALYSNNTNDDDDGMVDDDAWINPPDDEYLYEEEEFEDDDDTVVLEWNEDVVVVEGDELVDVQ